MTVMGAINHINAVKPNTYGQSEKIKWLSNLDGIIKTEVIDTHESAPEFVKNESTGKLELYIFGIFRDSFELTAEGGYKSAKTGIVCETEEKLQEMAWKALKEPFKGYTDSSLMAEMLVPAPYDDIYIKWLEAQIDYANGEYAKYNNSISMYNAAYDAYAKWYNRTHMPIQKEFTHF